MSEADDGASRCSGAEWEELDRLRRENRLLRVENEMLTRIATEYALERRDGVGRTGPGWSS
ncbi:transposase-like protein [Saccharopolyspora lacisalsi]|uniref:Transposase-like protein n=1 Tax=Halosaccharopolyspora lacisalsi TaxID=1000566 RepID=A0A839E570_9PSEU|nr:hypothetical protein [Halosaccharopolyspora lacisalsi]MBA8826048.1 transposase-like protein [Halosaccharopolyspora lacisalsi]